MVGNIWKSTIVLALVLIVAAPIAWAAPGGDKDGDADSDPGTTYTEDNDTNDGGTPNNVPDEGDNQHPSGKDRSVENGNSERNPNQGKAESDPDDDGRGPDRTNGGPDKPNGSGGDDLADQDGNNGCGNDDDFEDDSEGHCAREPYSGARVSSDTQVIKGKPAVDQLELEQDRRKVPAGSTLLVVALIPAAVIVNILIRRLRH